ncbi:partial Hydrazine synthase subunit beta, partial [Anaerolineae bacterium]
MTTNIRVAIAATLAFAAMAAQAAPLAYVPNEKDGNVSVIDTSTDKVIKTLPNKGRLGEKIQATAIDPAGDKLYVVVRDANAVAMIDLKSGDEKTRVDVGDEPEGISISPDGKTLAACLEEENAVSF